MSESAPGSGSRSDRLRRSGDESPPPGGGVFRRLAPSSGSALGGAMGALENVFAPAAKAAREELERQRIAGQRNPSDTDPPNEDDAPQAHVVAPGRKGTPFSGSITLTPGRPPASPPESAGQASVSE